MNVTFILGNGFDLNCGLRSSYNDVIKKYIQHSATDRVLENPAVERFKRKIEEDISRDSKLWSDFECGMAEEDMDELMLAIQKAYEIAKENNRKYARKDHTEKND